jgi:1-acyl-sn-glycerol-3-phosphate acyltransferase
MTDILGPRRLSVFRIIRVITKVAFYPFFSIKIKGMENIPRKGSFILLPKHQRWEDIPLIGISIGRPLYYMAKHELFNNRISSWFISSLGGLPLNRTRPASSRKSMEWMIELVKKGEGVVIFPEGTYYKERMGPGHRGLIRMILSRLETVLIPVGIRYMKDRPRTPVRIGIGRPLCGGPSSNIYEITDHVMKEIADLSGFAKGENSGRS